MFLISTLKWLQSVRLSDLQYVQYVSQWLSSHNGYFSTLFESFSTQVTLHLLQETTTSTKAGYSNTAFTAAGCWVRLQLCRSQTTGLTHMTD